MVGQTIGGRDPNYQDKLILNLGTRQRALGMGNHEMSSAEFGVYNLVFFAYDAVYTYAISPQISYNAKSADTSSEHNCRISMFCHFLTIP